MSEEQRPQNDLSTGQPLEEIAAHLRRALEVADAHGVAVSAAPHIDLALNLIQNEIKRTATL
jgi:hypothetical protein